MDSARQVIRWSMPGWVLLFGITVFQFIQNICVYRSVVDAMEHSALTRLTPGAAAVVIGAGVPLGFLIFQLYYHAYDKWMPFSLAPEDRGGVIIRSLPLNARTKLEEYEPEIDITEMCSQVENKLVIYLLGPGLPRLKPEYRDSREHRRENKERYRKNRQVNFEAIRFYLALISTELESDNFKNEYTTLSDIYHAIGASRVALILSFLIYASYNLFVPTHRDALLIRYGWPLMINLLIFGWAIAIFQSRRGRTSTACQAMLSHTARWYALRTVTSERTVYMPFL